MVDITKVGERTARRHDALNKEMKDDWAKLAMRLVACRNRRRLSRVIKRWAA